MCGRYTNETEFSQIRLLFQADDRTFRPWTPKYNISPAAKAGFEQLIVTADTARSRQLRLARFWLIPSFWSKPLSLLPTTFNARSEELSHKKLWREPYAHTRCLIPATGWREFVDEASGDALRDPERRLDGSLNHKTRRGPVRKQPYHFCPRSPAEASPGQASPEQAASEPPRPFAFAGLWSSWTSPAGEVVDSFAILTTTPSVAARSIHDRMPLVLAPELYDSWLTADAERDQVLSQARASASELELTIFPSDPLANSVHYEGPAACRRVEPGDPLGLQPARKKPDPDQRQLSLLDPLPKTDRRN